MSILDELFELYKKSSAIKIKAQKIHKKSPLRQSSVTPLEFGDVVEIYCNNMMIIAAIVDESEAILMSEFWEFAQNTDMIVNLEHPIGNKWIIELDNRLFLNDKSVISYYSSLSEEDKDILKKVLDGEELPPHKSGPKLPFNPKDPRWKFKREELKKNLEFNKNLFFENDANIIYFDFNKSLFSVERKAAFDATKLFKKNDANILINQKSLIIDVTDKNIGKYVKIYLKLEGTEIVLFEGITEVSTFEIISKTPIKNPYALKDMLEVDIYDNKP